MLRVRFVLLVLVPNIIRNANGDELPWLHAPDVIDAICPGQYTCTQGSDTSNTPIQGHSCCRQCSCDTNCGGVDALPCCFIDTPREDYETCLYPRSSSNNKYTWSSSYPMTQSLYMVTNSPSGGCVDGRSRTCGGQGSSNMAPVYSSLKNKIYLNAECASCHGANDAVPFDRSIVCDPLGSSRPLEYDQEIDKLLSHYPSSMCFYYYHLYYNKAIISRQCLLHTRPSKIPIFQSRNNDQLHYPYNMSAEDVYDACFSSLYVPVFSQKRQGWYPNPFCFLYEEGGSEKQGCPAITSATNPIPFIALVEGIQTEVVRSNKVNWKVHELCFQDEMQLMKGGPCRPLLCPLGHVYNSKEGRCGPFGNAILYNGRLAYGVHLILKSFGNSSVDWRSLPNVTVSDLTKGLALPPEWKLVFMATADGDVSQPDELLIRIVPQARAFNKVIDSLKTYLDKTLNLTDGILNHTYHQRFYPEELTFSKNIELREFTQSPPKLCIPEKSQTKILMSEFTICWRCLYVSFNIYSETLPLSKMYLCDMIELLPGEYDVIENGSILYYRLKGIYLFKPDFLLIENELGKYTAKICLEDFGFGTLVDSGEKSASVLYFLMVTVSIISLI